MKITKNTKSGDEIWVGVCRVCKSEAEATESELAVEYDFRDNFPFAWHKCPVCGADGCCTKMLFYPKAKV
jgi:hypothetical protein